MTVTEAARVNGIDRMLSSLVEPALADLTTRLRSVGGLSGRAQGAVRAGAATALRGAVWHHVSRVAVLEFQAARLTGALTATDPAGRWAEWVERLVQPGAWEAVARPYPALLPRLRRMTANRCQAAATLACRFSRDRRRLVDLLGTAPGELMEVRFGAGDSHQGGQTVAILGCAAGRLVYKPRSVRVDAALGRLLPRLLPDEPAADRIWVPAVLPRRDRLAEYGWAAYVAHRYCANDTELAGFYRGLGHWLAVMRLLGGSDLHSDNLIADGRRPVVVDCETLFTPYRAPRPSGYGAAVDLATDLLGQSVLQTGLLPGRGAALGWRGVDASGTGFLAGQQPVVQRPAILGKGTDDLRHGTAPVPLAARSNHPSPEPDLARYWTQVVDGFTELTSQLRARDRAGELAPLLGEFADCPIRVVVRGTAAYAELGRMLWHPSSLHQPGPAARRAAQLLARQGRRRGGAVDDPAVIEAEVAELLDGDIPVFVTTPGSGILAGPRGTRWGAAEDLVAAALRRWRGADLPAERRIVQATLVGAYLNDGSSPGPVRTIVPRVRAGDLDVRRRAQAAGIMRQLAGSAIRAEDGTATWVAATLDPTGWAVRPLSSDLYGGGTGVAVLLAGYLREVAAGRADPVSGLATLLAAVVRTLQMAGDRQEAEQAEAAGAKLRVRPDPPGGYLGLGSRIWGWLLLQRLGAVTADEATRRAEALADRLPDAVAGDTRYDLLSGMAGAVVPLLRLAEQTGQDRWLRLAEEIGDQLRSATHRSDAGACWPTEQYPAGIGGLSHGVVGIGWSLARLAATREGGGAAAEFRELADAAFAWQASLYDPQRNGWRDLRPSRAIQTAATWCHGSVGIGLAAADPLSHPGHDWPELLHRAACATWPGGFGTNHTLCHGDFGAWEVLERAWTAGVGPPGLDREAVAAQILSGLEAHGPVSGSVSGSARNALAPGMLPGVGGVAFQLLRMHPDCRLPSVLLPDPGPVNPG